MDRGEGFGGGNINNGNNATTEDALSFGAKAGALSPALGGLLQARAAAAALEDDETERDADWKMLVSMCEFPGYEPRTESERSYVCRQYGLDPAALPGAAPAHRESLRAFVKRKLCPRQPPGFADLVASMLARDPKRQAHRGGGDAVARGVGGTAVVIASIHRKSAN
jgi:predicted HicB family RNase H-like nuclease